MPEFNIDEILLETSYRSKKGYIDLDLIEDIHLLENTMYEMKFSPEIITELINSLIKMRPKSSDDINSD